LLSNRKGYLSRTFSIHYTSWITFKHEKKPLAGFRLTRMGWGWGVRDLVSCHNHLCQRRTLVQFYKIKFISTTNVHGLNSHSVISYPIHVVPSDIYFWSKCNLQNTLLLSNSKKNSFPVTITTKTLVFLVNIIKIVQSWFILFQSFSLVKLFSVL
jgi:hypothetical protein